MATITNSLVTQLGNKMDAKAFESFAEAAKRATEVLTGFGEAVSSAFEKLEKFFHGAAERMGGVQEFAERMSMSAREVAALDKVAVQNGSSVAAMESTIASLNIVVARAASGFSDAQETLRRFGLHAKNARGDVKSFDEAMADVIDRMQGASAGKRLAMADALGIDPKLIPFLIKGIDSFRHAREAALKANPLSAGDYQAADAVEKGFKRAGEAIETLKDRIAVALFPTVNRVLERIVAWTENEQNVQALLDTVNKVVDVLATLYRVGNSTFEWLANELPGGISTLVISLGGLAAAFGLMKLTGISAFGALIAAGGAAGGLGGLGALLSSPAVAAIGPWLAWAAVIYGIASFAIPKLLDAVGYLDIKFVSVSNSLRRFMMEGSGQNYKPKADPEATDAFGDPVWLKGRKLSKEDQAVLNKFKYLEGARGVDPEAMLPGQKAIRAVTAAAAMPFAPQPAQSVVQQTSIGELNLNIQGGNLDNP